MLAKLDRDKARLAGSKTRLEAVVPRNPVEVEAMRFALGFNEVMGHIGTGIGIGASTVSTLTGKHLHADILTFNQWANEKVFRIKEGKSKDILHHYDGRMDDAVKRIQKRLGPTERFLFNGSTKDALFNGVRQSLKPDPISIGIAERVKHVATGAKITGAALLVVDAGLTCHKLSETAEKDKLETAYREIGGIVGSLATGALVGIAVTTMATPVGWIGGIVMGAGTAFGGKAAGEFVFNSRFKARGDMFNLKDGRLINSWCK